MNETRLNLRAKLILMLLAVGLLPLLVTGVINIALTTNTLRQGAIDTEQINIQNQADTIERFLDAPLNDILLLSQSAHVTEMSEAIAENNGLLLQQERRAVEQEFENFIRHRKFDTTLLYERIRFLDSDGFELVRIDNTGDFISRASGVGLNVRSEKDYYQQALPLASGEIYVSPMELFDEYGRLQEPYTPVLHYSTPVYYDELLIGVVVTDVRAQGFLDAIEGSTPLNTTTLLVDKDGYYLFHPDPERRFGRDLGTEINLQLDQPELEPVLQSEFPDMLELSENIAFYHRVVPPGQTDNYWYLILLRPFDALLAAARQQQTTLVFASVVVGLVVTGVGVMFAQGIGGTIVQLTRTATEIAAGNLDRRVQIQRDDELGTLANAFNSMTDQIRDLIGNLERRVADRTRDLETASEVSKQVAALLDRGALLNLLVDLTQARFNLDHAQVFMVEDSTLILKAGTGQRNYSGRTSIPLKNEHSTIARAARSREPLIIKDTKQNPQMVFDTVVSETRSEMLVPLVAGQQLIGVLDLQSREVNRFDENDIRVMSTLAGQVAIALENARLYQEQVAVTEKLREVDRLKSQFLANMSHELRTPLNAVLNFTEFIANGIFGEVNEAQGEALNKVLASSEHLLSLINDILDLTKIESGMMELFIEQVNLSEEVETVLSTARGLIKSKPVELIVQVEEPLPVIDGDRRRIRQVLLNLLSNAIKFTAEGSITFTLRAQCEEIYCSVRDTGVGIAPEDQSIVFESFRQGRHGLRQNSSTGLGLPISKHLVEAHGGRMWLESQVGVGSTFFFTLPVKVEEAVAKV